MKIPALLVSMLMGSTSGQDGFTNISGPGGDNWVKIGYDASKSMVKFEADVGKDQWFAVGFGPSMRDVDMVVFQGKDEGVLQDLWQSGAYYATPDPDVQQDYKDVKIEVEGDRYHFTAYREMDTGDE